MKVVVVGGGKVGFYLMRALLEHGHQVALIERRLERCKVIAAEERVLVIHGDGTDPDVLADAGADRADVLASVTGNDEENLLVCQTAKRRFEVSRVIARINNPKNEEVFRQLGVNLAVSGTGIIAELIEREMARGMIRTLLTFHHGDLTILEVDLTDRSPAAGKAVSELAGVLPPELVLVAVLRGDRVMIPRGFTVLNAGDTVMALAHTASAAGLNRVLLGEG